MLSRRRLACRRSRHGVWRPSAGDPPQTWLPATQKKSTCSTKRKMITSPPSQPLRPQPVPSPTMLRISPLTTTMATTMLLKVSARHTLRWHQPQQLRMASRMRRVQPLHAHRTCTAAPSSSPATATTTTCRSTRAFCASLRSRTPLRGLSAAAGGRQGAGQGSRTTRAWRQHSAVSTPPRGWRTRSSRPSPGPAASPPRQARHAGRAYVLPCCACVGWTKDFCLLERLITSSKSQTVMLWLCALSVGSGCAC